MNLYETFTKHVKAVKRKSVAFLLLRLVLLVGLMVFLGANLWAAFILMAILRVTKHFVGYNMSQSYVVDEYIGNTKVGSYETTGTLIGGLLKMGVIIAVVVWLGDRVLTKYFPENVFWFELALYVGAFWVMAAPMVREIVEISGCNTMLREFACGSKPVDLMQKEHADRVDKAAMVFGGVMAVIVVLAVLMQFAVLWVGAGVRHNRLEKQAYDAYCEYREENPECLELDEEWFEEQMEDKHRGYKRFKTEASLITDGVMEERGIIASTYDQVDLIWEDGAWQVTGVYRDLDEIESMHVTGTWYGEGEDSYVIYKDQPACITIRIDELTKETVSGHIRCTYKDEVAYEGSFSGDAKEVNGVMEILAAMDTKIFGVTPDILFRYDYQTDELYGLVHASEVVFEKQG